MLYLKNKIKYVRILIVIELLFLIFSINIVCSLKPKESVNIIPLEQLRSMKESPMLAELVKKGKLPPLEERLPEDPLIIEPYEKIGVHGGEWHFDVISKRDVNLAYHITNSSFLKWDREAMYVIPYLCKEYEMSEDGRIWTFYLRKGIKWSDGHPFTTEDVRFWYEDDTMNRDINPTPKMELQIGDYFGKIEILNDYNFRVVFPCTFKGFYKSMVSYILFYSPSHYLKQFHIKYADKEQLEQRMKKAGVKKWSELFIKMDRWYEGYYNPDRPMMRPWILSQEGSSPNTYEFVRNPYFWAVDTEGKQLPYIDKIVVHIASNDQVLAMKTIAGDFDFQWRRLDFKDFPLLKENEEKHNYRLLKWPQDRGSDVALYINYNCIHPVMGPLLRERKFRIALSLAINRDELNLLFYKNIGKPRQVTAAESMPFYVPEYAKKYADYDVEQSNILLDELGLTKRNEKGFRLDSEGNLIFLFLETSDLNKVDILEIVSEYWCAVGIKTEVKVMEGSLLTKRTHSAQVMIQARPHGSFDRRIHGRSDYIAPLFGLWKNTLGMQGEEPTDEFKKVIWLGDEIMRNDITKEIALYKQLYKIFAENVWMIGLVGEIPALLVKKNYFMNVPDKSLYSFARGRRLGLTRPEQYWIDPTMKK